MDTKAGKSADSRKAGSGNESSGLTFPKVFLIIAVTAVTVHLLELAATLPGKVLRCVLHDVFNGIASRVWGCARDIAGKFKLFRAIPTAIHC